MIKHAAITFALLVSLFTAVTESQAQTLGRFRGTVEVLGKKQVVNTEIYLNKQKQLVGRYHIIDDAAVVKGTLSQFKPIGEYGGTFVWKDDSGQGVLRCVFSSDFESFSGYWGLSKYETKYSWSGHHEVMVASAARRLAALKKAKERSSTVNQSTNGIPPYAHGDHYRHTTKDAIAKALFWVGAYKLGQSAIGKTKGWGKAFAVGGTLLASYQKRSAIEKAINQLFPTFDERMVRHLREAVELLIDGQLTLENLSKEAAKSEFINLLKEKNSELGQVAEAADFMVEIHQIIKSKQ